MRPRLATLWLSSTSLRSHGLTAEQAAAGLGHSRASLYRWARAREPSIRRPHRVRPKAWTAELIEAVARIRHGPLGDRAPRQAHRRAPFRVRGIQVDGGSEFRAEFEEACRTRGLALYALPPKRPQLNGAVERAQGSWRYAFYGCFDLPHRIDKLQQHVDAFAHRFNHHRPHQALGGKTPAEYLAAISNGHLNASQMC